MITDRVKLSEYTDEGNNIPATGYLSFKWKYTWFVFPCMFGDLTVQPQSCLVVCLIGFADIHSLYWGFMMIFVGS